MNSASTVRPVSIDLILRHAINALATEDAASIFFAAYCVSDSKVAFVETALPVEFTTSGDAPRIAGASPLANQGIGYCQLASERA